MENIRETEKVSVIGLGQMGLKLATLLTETNREVTVWNRSLSKAALLKGGYRSQHSRRSHFGQ
ncbi:MAG: NAD(P)-binding domain-containing protein [Mangrovibacterium sp.]